mmetsp:Transcript_83993/g.271464  ORF Transcript_83993/g.271464 Transcript_83993/m.271464 type:complete len:203 (+) Transcript_83993:2061-2669(+)
MRRLLKGVWAGAGERQTLGGEGFVQAPHRLQQGMGGAAPWRVSAENDLHQISPLVSADVRAARLAGSRSHPPTPDLPGAFPWPPALHLDAQAGVGGPQIGQQVVQAPGRLPQQVLALEDVDAGTELEEHGVDLAADELREVPLHGLLGAETGHGGLRPVARADGLQELRGEEAAHNGGQQPGDEDRDGTVHNMPREVPSEAA